jgi:hypothetical protein
MMRSLNGSVCHAPPYDKYSMLTTSLPVIVLIAAEILVAAVNIVVDLYVGE